MITEQTFIGSHENEWQKLENYLAMSKRKRKNTAMVNFPLAYRRLCEHLALAESAGFSPALITRLNYLAVQGHQLLYQHHHNTLTSITDYFSIILPRAVRKHWRYFAIAAALFIIPLLIGLIVGTVNPDYAAKVGSTYEQMYEPIPNKRIGESREASSDILMWGFYIFNNTSIGLRTIIGGIFFGLGVVASLLYNGWHLGIISAHMLHIGYAWITFFPFIITHAAFELTAIVFSGATGLAIAKALFIPGRHRRGESIRNMLHSFFPILVAMVIMFFLAAWIEAFWSAIWFPPAVKFTVGGLLWILVLGYFILVGRINAAADH